MFGEKVIELLKEAERNRETIDQYNVSHLNNICSSNYKKKIYIYIIL